PDGGAAVGGEPGNQSLLFGASGDASGLAGSDDDPRGGGFGNDGIQADPVGAGGTATPAGFQPSDEAARLNAQRSADALRPVPGDLDNVRATLPYLLEGQQEDVFKAETRFAK